MQNRRTFLGQIGTGAMLAGLPLSLESLREFAPGVPSRDASSWDESWIKRVTGKYRAVFDVAAIDSGRGAWRATVWQKQYADVLKARPSDMSTVLVLRAEGIALAMQQPFWDEYAIGKENDVKHPVTNELTDRNPALLSSTRKEVPAMFDALALDQFIAHGGIALACDLAFNDMIGLVSRKHGLADDAARKIAIGALVPGVTLQPSGVFAALRAQDVGCNYIRAS
ncbi:MAG: hypothetical protein M3Z05_18585 [Gemmatimonadota bacterium]|nr:hypothetical protein [Gemmatimonadota bacterium]